MMVITLRSSSHRFHQHHHHHYHRHHHHHHHHHHRHIIFIIWHSIILYEATGNSGVWERRWEKVWDNLKWLKRSAFLALKVWKWGFVNSKKDWNQIKIWTLTSLEIKQGIVLHPIKSISLLNIGKPGMDDFNSLVLRRYTSQISTFSWIWDCSNKLTGKVRFLMQGKLQAAQVTPMTLTFDMRSLFLPSLCLSRLCLTIWRSLEVRSPFSISCNSLTSWFSLSDACTLYNKSVPD